MDYLVTRWSTPCRQVLKLRGQNANRLRLICFRRLRRSTLVSRMIVSAAQSKPGRPHQKRTGNPGSYYGIFTFPFRNQCVFGGSGGNRTPVLNSSSHSELRQFPSFDGISIYHRSGRQFQSGFPSILNSLACWSSSSISAIATSAGHPLLAFWSIRTHFTNLS